MYILMPLKSAILQQLIHNSTTFESAINVLNITKIL